MVYSDALQTARSSACRVLETCRGSTVVMLLMYRRKSVGEMTPPCGTPSRIFTLLLRWPSSFTLADLSCRKHRIHLYIFPEMPLSSIFSRRPSRQTLSKAKTDRQPDRQTETEIFRSRWVVLFSFKTVGVRGSAYRLSPAPLCRLEGLEAKMAQIAASLC